MDGEHTILDEEDEEDEEIADSKSSLSGGIFNLTNTVLGGGISFISLPLAVKQSGVLLMPFIEIVSFATSCFTCHLLVLISKSSGETSFSRLGERFLGRAALVVPCLIVMNNLGVMIAFLEVFADVLPPLLQDAVGDGTGSFLVDRSTLLVLVTLLLLIPVVLVRTISGFVVVSLVATGGATLFAIFAISISLSQAPVGNDAMTSFPIAHNEAVSVSSVLSAISIISLSWTCQFNVLPIFNSLQDRTVSGMRRVIVTSMGIALSSYILFGICAYFRYRDLTTGDTLSDFDDTGTGRVLRVVVVVALLLTFPLFVFEAAHNLDVILKAFCSCTNQEKESAKSVSSIKDQPADRTMKQRLRQSASSFGSFNRSFYSGGSFISSEDQNANGGGSRIRVQGTICTVFACGVTILVKDTSTVIGLVGAGCGMPIGYVMPPLIYILSQNEEESFLEHLEVVGSEQPRAYLKVLAWTVLIGGGILSATCVVNALLDF